VISAPLGPPGGHRRRGPRARARRWRPGWSGWSPTGWSARTGVLGLTFNQEGPRPSFADRVRLPSPGAACAAPGPLNTELPGPDKPGSGGNRGPVRRGPGDRHLSRPTRAGWSATTPWREGLEPSMRLITPRPMSWQLAAQIVAAYDRGPMERDHLDAADGPPRPCSRLAGDLAEQPARYGATSPAVGRWLTAEHDALPGRISGGRSEDNHHPGAPGSSFLLPLVSRYAAAQGRARGAGPRGSGGRWAARIASRQPREVGARPEARAAIPGGPCSTSTRTPATPSWCCCGRCSAAGTQ